jgi:uncharacterized protein YecT (DUF1311 family)
MRQFLGRWGLLFAAVWASPAAALNCAKASQPIEKMLCSTAELRKADDDMSAAYFKLLHETKDPDFHTALIRSQLRWLKERLLGPQRFSEDKTDDREVLLKVTRDRLAFLTSGKPVRTMENQRKMASRDSGGPFAGYTASCNFGPARAHWLYGCWSSVYRQHHGRVCSVSESGSDLHFSDYWLVGVVEKGKLKAVATCSIGYAGTNAPCPDHWATDLGTPLESMPELWKYDPDFVHPANGLSWMEECLSARVFPPPELSRSNEPR